MGNFYVNYTVHGSNQGAVVAALSGRKAKVTPSRNNCIIVFDQQSDEQDQKIISGLASELSAELNCHVWAVLNHDDDILWYQLYNQGQLTDVYDSSPGYFDPDAEPSLPKGGSSERLCAAFEVSAIKDVEAILRKSSYDDDGYIFAYERHSDLVQALNIPSFGVGASYSNLDNGEYPEGISDRDIITIK